MVPVLWPKCKAFLEAAFVPAIIVLVAAGAFGLGRLSVLQSTQDTLAAHYPPEASTTAQTQVQ